MDITESVNSSCEWTLCNLCTLNNNRLSHKYIHCKYDLIIDYKFINVENYNILK